MSEEQDKAKGRLLSKLLLIKNDLQGINKPYVKNEFKIIIEEIKGRVETLIQILIQEIK